MTLFQLQKLHSMEWNEKMIMNDYKDFEGLIVTYFFIGRNEDKHDELHLWPRFELDPFR
jgi:hypothetical protein